MPTSPRRYAQPNCLPRRSLNPSGRSPGCAASWNSAKCSRAAAQIPWNMGHRCHLIRPAAPTVEDVVIVPHHQRRTRWPGSARTPVGSRGHSSFRSSRRAASAISDVKHARRRRQGASSAIPRTPGPRAISDRHRADRRPAAAGERVLGMPRREVQPALVALSCRRPTHRPSRCRCRRCRRGAARSRAPRQMHPPALPPDPVVVPRSPAPRAAKRNRSATACGRSARRKGAAARERLPSRAVRARRRQRFRPERKGATERLRVPRK